MTVELTIRASRLHSPLWPNHSQKPPYGIAEIDPGHPITQGLRSYVLMGAMPVDLVRRSVQITLAGPVPTAGKGGGGLYFDHTNGYGTMPATGLPYQTGTSLTLAASALPYSSLGAATAYTLHDADSSRMYFGLWDVRFELFNDGRDSYFAVPAGLQWQAGDLLPVVATWDKATDTQQVYLKGKPLPLESRWTSWGNSAFGTQFTVGSNYSHSAGVGWLGAIYVQIFWGRVLSQAEIAAVSANPYQLLRSRSRVRRVSYVVIGANVAPVANAGVDQSVAQLLPATATLAGSATDDGLPSPPAALTYLWTKISGPGTATFVDATDPTTDVGFDTYGTYVLRLTVSDSLLTGSDDVSITVSLPVPVWKRVMFLEDFAALSVFSDNGAAGTGGVPVGRPYRTSSGVVMVRY